MRAAANAGRDWDAEAYDRVADPQYEWGLEVLGRLPLRGDETVLDAGCGTGRVTAHLLERLPRGRVVAVDASEAMVSAARERLGARAKVLCADLAELSLDEPVDAVFSSAVFHWVPDHDRLFERLRAALRPGGRLLAQCGGEGNVASVVAAIRAARRSAPFAGFPPPPRGTWHFAAPGETVAALERAGFVEARAWLEPKPVTVAEPRDFLRAVTLGPHLERLPDDLHAPFVDAVAERMGRPPVFDYVRLNIDARRRA